ncbi:MAG: hypothetical protein HC904_17080 [Blastochloris sp.]|nr:hypothetical protein [Blastochloris sp.]
MLQPNGTIETAMSTRQDQGQEIFPHQLGAAFLWMAGITNQDLYLSSAQAIFQGNESSLVGCIWSIYVLSRFPHLEGREPIPLAPLRMDKPVNQVSRRRHGAWSITCLGNALSDAAAIWRGQNGGDAD